MPNDRPPTVQVRIDPNDLRATITNPVLWPKLEMASKILEDVPELTVRHVQNQRGWEKAALYLVLRASDRDERIANFTAWVSGQTKLELRHKGYLDDAIWQRLPVQSGPWRYFDLAHWPLEEVIDHTRTYVCRIAPDVASRKVRRGSAGSREVHRLLVRLLGGPGEVCSETCPPLIRQHIGGKPRFDFFLPHLGRTGVLVEVDGAQHRQPVAHWGGQEALEKRKAADAAKDDACARFGVGLVRIDAHGRDAALWALSEVEFCELLRTALDRAATGKLVEIGLARGSLPA